MDSIGAPLDEEGEQAAAIVFQIQGFPLKEAAVGALARAGMWSIKRETGIAETNCELIQVAGMSGPADEARLAKFLESVVIWRGGLLRIGRDDFQVVFFAEREKSVAGATSRMDAAKCGANTGVFFDEVNAAIEIAAAEKNVIEHDGHFNSSEGHFWRGEGSSG